MRAGREFQLLGEDTQKAREAKDDLTREGTALYGGMARLG